MSWNELMDAAYSGHESMKDYQDLNGLAKSHINMQKMLGDSIRIPSADASQEDRKAFYQKITSKVEGLSVMPSADDADATAAFWQKAGVPQKKEDYKVMEGASEEAFNDLKEMAMSANLTKKQFEALTGGMSKKQAEALEAATNSMTEGQEALFSKWGVAKDKNLEAIKNLMKGSDAPAEMLASLEAGTLDAGFLGWAEQMVKAVSSEGGEFQKQQGFGKGTDMLSPSEAEAQIGEIFNNKEHAYWNNASAGHADAVKKVMRLQHMVNGDTPPK